MKGARLAMVLDLASAQAAGPAPALVREHFPALAQPMLLGVAGWQWVAIASSLAASVGVGLAVSHLSFLVSRALSNRKSTGWFVVLHRAIRMPLAALLALVGFDLAMHFVGLTGHARSLIDTGAYQLLIAGLAWLAIVAGGSIAGTLQTRLIGVDEYGSRGLRTELKVALRVYVIFVIVAGVVLILKGIHVIEHVGVSLLASAGLASVVIGLAAQKSLGGILAGIQLSVTQPVRLGDTVVVDTMYGTVEEIRLTYIILRLWDLRRMVIPVNRFLETSFENWTRIQTDLMGTVELMVSDELDLAAFRAELARICKSSPLWNGKHSSVRVVDAGDKQMKLEAVISADGPTALFDLRFEVREKLLVYLRSVRLSPPPPVPASAKTTAAAPSA